MTHYFELLIFIIVISLSFACTTVLIFPPQSGHGVKLPFLIFHTHEERHLPALSEYGFDYRISQCI